MSRTGAGSLRTSRPGQPSPVSAAILGLVLSVPVALAACGPLAATASNGSYEKKAPVMSNDAPGWGHLALVGFQMEDGYRRPLTMSADGVISGPHGVWGRATPDGDVTYPDGRVRGHLTSDGRLVDSEGAPLATIDADGNAKVGNIDLRFDPDGQIVGGNPGQSIRLTTPGEGVHRIAMLVFLLTQLRP